MPPPRVGHETLSSRRDVDHTYRSSYKQLSEVQQRQVGLVLGAAVGDGAGRSFDGYDATTIAQHVERSRREEMEARAWKHDQLSNTTHGTSSSSSNNNNNSSGDAVEDLLCFADVPLLGHVQLSASGEAERIQRREMNPLHQHSFSYTLFVEVIRAMHHARGDFAPSAVDDGWSRAAHRVDATHVFAQEHGSLLHLINTVVALPVVYPYASDAALRRFADPLLEKLSTPMDAQHNNTNMKHNWWEEAVSSRSSSFSLADALEANRIAACDYARAAMSVPLRCLQSNPSPIRNAAFNAPANTSAIFPSPHALHCPTMLENDDVDVMKMDRAQRRHDINVAMHEYYTECVRARGAEEVVGPRPVLYDAAVVREALAIVDATTTKPSSSSSSSSICVGIGQAVALGGRTGHRAMLVGAMLGARCGVRCLPSAWLNATAGVEMLATMATEISQWAWNPPHH